MEIEPGDEVPMGYPEKAGNYGYDHTAVRRVVDKLAKQFEADQRLD